MFDLKSVPYFPVKLEKYDGNWTFSNPVTGKLSELNGSVVQLLKRCNGYHTLGEIIDELASVYCAGSSIILETAVPVLQKLTNEGVIWWRDRRMNFWNLPPPMAVLWDITGRCNLRCLHCVVDSDSSRDAGFSLEECYRLVDEMAGFGVQQLILSGGEPTLRPDFLDICSYSVDKGLSLQVATNATLITGRMARTMLELGVMAQVSLDAPFPDIHDNFRQTPGAWKRCLRGIRMLLKAGVKVTLAATVTTRNIGVIPGLYYLAAHMGVDTFRILPFVPGGRGSLSRELEVSPEQMKKLTLQLNQRREEIGLSIAPMEFECTLSPPPPTPDSKELHVGCDGAIAYCTISSSGDVLPCNFFSGMEAENVRYHDFEWIWRNSAILNYFRSLVIGDIRGQCQSCDWLGACRGSCLAANFAHGDLFQSNCHCWLVRRDGEKWHTGLQTSPNFA